MLSNAELIEQTMTLIAKIADLTTQMKALEAELIDRLELDGSRTASTQFAAGQRMVATVVRPERTVIDEEKLAKVLGWHFAEVSELKLNRAKLEEAIQQGKIDFKDVAKHTTIKDSKPYVRYTVVQEDGEE